MRDALGAIGRRGSHALAAMPPWSILAIGWVALIVYAYPGLMTQDSFDHLREARAGVFTDSHPPAIDLLWRWVDYVIAGPFGMLVIQSVTFLLGLYLVLQRTFTPRRAAWLAVGLFVFPPVMTPMAVIWKDCVMAGFLMLGIGGLSDARRWVRVASLAALGAGIAVRYNGFAATLPIVVLGFEWRPGLGGWRRYAIAAAAWLAITIAAFGLNAAITDQKMYLWHSGLAVFDITGTLAEVDGELSDDELGRTLAGTGLLVQRDLHAAMRKVYTPHDFYPILADPKLALWSLPINGYTPAPEPQRDAIARAWWAVLTAHPRAYLAHRLAVMAKVLEARSAEVIARREFQWPEYAKQVGLGTGWSKLQRKLTRFEVWIARTTPVFTPWLYALLALVMLPLARGQRDVLALLLGGLVFESTLVLLAPSSDYRYSHWLVITTCLGAVVLTARRYRAAAAYRLEARKK
jgi:hypothetical protein